MKSAPSLHLHYIAKYSAKVGGGQEDKTDGDQDWSSLSDVAIGGTFIEICETKGIKKIKAEQKKVLAAAEEDEEWTPLSGTYTEADKDADGDQEWSSWSGTLEVLASKRKGHRLSSGFEPNWNLWQVCRKSDLV